MKDEILDRMNEQLDELLGPKPEPVEYIDPIQLAHNEYQTEQLERMYMSDEWVSIQKEQL
jgi:hypothetical protein